MCTGYDCRSITHVHAQKLLGADPAERQRPHKAAHANKQLCLPARGFPRRFVQVTRRLETL